MMTRSKLGLLSAAMFMVACSGGNETKDGGSDGGNPTDSGGNPDVVVKKDGGDGGGNCGMTPDIAGQTDLAIHVQEFNFGMANPQDIGGVAVRVEQAGDCGGFLEGTTDQSGVAHIKVDTSKGPFDVTAALKDYDVISIIGVTGPVAQPIIIGKNGAASVFTTYKAAGNITNKKGGGAVQIDAAWWSTVNTTTTSYANNNFQTANTGNSPPLEVTGLEVDNAGTVINAVYVKYMGTGVRPKMNVTGFDVAFPGNANGFSTANVTVNWPNAGILKGADIKNVGDPNPNDKHLGKGVVLAKHFSNPNGDMFVGVGDTALPANNVPTVKIQAAASGDMQPNFWEASYYTGQGMVGDTFVRIHSTTLNNGGMFSVGQINTLDGSGMNELDTKFGADTVGYDAVSFVLYSQDAMSQTYAAWIIYKVGSTLPMHNVPHLPKAVKVDDIAINGITNGELHVLKYEGGSQAPWTETNKYANVVVAKPIF